jgi:hypothetical protein
MHAEPHHTAEELRRLAARQTTPRLWRRSRRIILAAPGQSAAKIATAQGRTPRSPVMGPPPQRRWGRRPGRSPRARRRAPARPRRAPPAPGEDRGRPDPRGRRLRLPRPRHPPRPRRRVRRRAGRACRLRPAPSPGTLLADAAADPPQDRPRGGGAFKKMLPRQNVWVRSGSGRALLHERGL